MRIAIGTYDSFLIANDVYDRNPNSYIRQATCDHRCNDVDCE
jgi:hypothetical protein